MNDDEKQYLQANYLSVNGITKNTNQTLNVAAKLKQNTNNFNNEIDVGKSVKMYKPFHEKKPTMQTAEQQLLFNVENQGLNDGQNEKSTVEEIIPKSATMQTVEKHSKTLPLNQGLQKFNDKLKNVKFLQVFSGKNAKIAVLIVVLAVALLMYINLMGANNNTTTTAASTQFNSLEYVSSKLYVENLENKLVSVLSKIQGAGNVSVLITLESGPELKIATSVDERTNTTTSSSTSTTSVTVIENPIIITQNGQSSPLVLMEIMPVIKGVVVVSEGAGNTKVKLQLLEAVQALLNISGNNIQIYAGI